MSAHKSVRREDAHDKLHVVVWRSPQHDNVLCHMAYEKIEDATSAAKHANGVIVEYVRAKTSKSIGAKAVAEHYNTVTLLKRREEYEKTCREYNEEPEPDHYVEVDANDLDMRKIWECVESPTKFCVYDWDNYSENCIFCGEPEERK